MHGRFQTHVRKVVRRVHAVDVLPADNQILKHSVAGKPVCGSRVADLVDIVEFHPDTVEIFLRLLPREPALVDILFIVGIHILIEAAGRNRVSARFDL